MILSDDTIRALIRDKKIGIDPEPNEEQFDTSSLDLRLGDEFFHYKDHFLDTPDGVDPPIFDPAKFTFQEVAGRYTKKLETSKEDGSVIIRPDDFVLASTLEKVELPSGSGIAARIEGRSTLARIGLSIHLTAPTVHLDWSGPLALEMKNHGRLCIKLTPGMRICQLIFERVEGEPTQSLGSTFKGQTSARGTKSS